MDETLPSRKKRGITPPPSIKKKNPELFKSGCYPGKANVVAVLLAGPGDDQRAGHLASMHRLKI